MEFSHRFFMSQDFALINPMQIDADIVRFGQVSRLFRMH